MDIPSYIVSDGNNIIKCCAVLGNLKRYNLRVESVLIKDYQTVTFIIRA